ncbi:hypothetical protein [Ruminococcus sp. HUN007]|uniref:hypothetical protein n=1 Tax=Ruminococcus sp. HUN007 TaxID=1514668 RepID=UPI0005D23A7C|nr:hypothetical protein [Ruminococcus sp. HUN007]
MSDNYEDIINHAHHVSELRPQMPLHDRAAQFAPFAALTGFGDEIDETARLTEDLVFLTEDRAYELNTAFNAMLESDRPEVLITFFKPDMKKYGGEYETYRGVFRFFDAGSNLLKFTDQTVIDADMVRKIEFVNKDQFNTE